MPEITKTDLETQRSPQWFWLVFFALTVFVYFYGLTIPFLGPDEARYAEVAREMFERGDWITPTLGGSNWFEKPALLYWFETVSYYFFGVNEFAARLGPALCGLGTVFSLWLIGRRAFPNTEFANWLAMAAASTLGLIVFSRGASFDIVITFAITASLACYFVHDLTERNRHLSLFCFYFFIGVALLAKGLIGLILPFAIAGLYQVFIRQRPDRKLLISVLWGVPLILIVAASWYLPMYLRHGYQFIDEFIVQQHFQRFTSNKYQHPQPFIFFFWVLPLMTIPWLPLFLAALWNAAAKLVPARWTRRTAAKNISVVANDHVNRVMLFSLAWILVPVIFFSFSGSKLPGYILPAVPGALLLSSIPLAQFVKKNGYRPSLIKSTAVGTYALVIIALIFLVPRFLRSETVKGLLATANSKGYQNLQVSGFIAVSHNAEFYAGGRLIRDEDGKQHRFIGAAELRDYIDSHGGTPLLIFCPLEHVRHLTNSDLIHTDVLDDNGELAVTVVRAR
jgi:4-amino-4-deoxy-L-arabinose transferase-like glycosyltransferase